MSETTRYELAVRILRLFPRAWRRRYEDELLEMLVQSPVRWRDLADLLRSAADEWERRLVRSAFRPVTLAGIGYVVLGVMWAVAGIVANAVVFPPSIDLRFIPMLPHVALMFLLPMYLLSVTVNLPLMVAVRLARHRLSVGTGRLVVAAGFAACGEWMLYRMEWFDVWRHGTPGFAYWATTLLPWGLAWASTGAVIGAGLVGDKAERNTREA